MEVPFSHIYLKENANNFHCINQDDAVINLKKALHVDPSEIYEFNIQNRKNNKILENWKRPFKKRHSTNHQPSNRVNKYLSQAITARSVTHEKSTHVNLITLSFNESSKEHKYQNDVDIIFTRSMTCALFLLLLIGLFQALILPKTCIFLLLYLTAFVWISAVLILLMAAKLKWIVWDIVQSFMLRLAITVFTIILVYSVIQVNVFTCRSDLPCFLPNMSILTKTTEIDFHSTVDEHRICPLPQYIVISCVLSFLIVAIFLKLAIILKTIIVLVISFMYILVIEFSHFELFQCYDSRIRSLVPQHILSDVYIVAFLLTILIHGRQVEWTSRLDFLWQIQASEEKKEMDCLQQNNKRILFNILPTHVAVHFLDNQFRSHLDLYNQSYKKVGVMFASITNYYEFYNEMDANSQGMECLRLLNEIIADIDELLNEDRFKSVDKIKTVGSTYMAAVGLIPEYKILDFPSDTLSSAAYYLSVLIEFVFAMNERLININENSYNNFMLRVGINIGPVVAGVIGARKPQYDIWGNTVNVASRMDTSGLPNHIQVTEDVYKILKNSPYEFKCRGKVNIKGKGEMITYFLTERKLPVTLRMDDLNYPTYKNIEVTHIANNGKNAEIPETENEPLLHMRNAMRNHHHHHHHRSHALMNKSKTYYFENQQNNSSDDKYRPPWPVIDAKKGSNTEYVTSTSSPVIRQNQNQAMSLSEKNYVLEKSIASSYDDDFSSSAIDSSSSSVSPNVSSSESEYGDNRKDSSESDIEEPEPEFESDNQDNNRNFVIEKDIENNECKSIQKSNSIHLTTITMLDKLDFDSNLQKSSTFSSHFNESESDLELRQFEEEEKRIVEELSKETRFHPSQITLKYNNNNNFTSDDGDDENGNENTAINTELKLINGTSLLTNNISASESDNDEYEDDDILDENNVSMSSLSKIGESDAVLSLESLSAFNESDYDLLPNNVYQFVPRVVYKDNNKTSQNATTNDDICTISKYITESFGN